MRNKTMFSFACGEAGDSRDPCGARSGGVSGWAGRLGVFRCGAGMQRNRNDADT